MTPKELSDMTINPVSRPLLLSYQKRNFLLIVSFLCDTDLKKMQLDVCNEPYLSQK